MNCNRQEAKRQIAALVVDDNEISRLMAQEVLRSCDVSADLAASGEEAIHMAGQLRYDLILMDYHMPGMDGPAAAREIRSLGGWNARVPIIALSADELGDIPPGMDGSTGKPLNPAALGSLLQPGAKNEPSGSAGQPLSEKLQRLQARCPELDIRRTLQQVGGAEGTLLDILAVYRAGVHKQIAAIEEYARHEDWENLRIAVHAQRGALSNIGAYRLAERAQEVESLLIQRDYTKSTEEIPGLTRGMLKLAQPLETLFEKADAPQKRSATKEQRMLLAVLPARVIARLDRLEREQALKEMRSAAALQYGDVVDRLLEEALLDIENFDYDGASALLRKLSDAFREV